MDILSRKALVADVGGTYISLAVADIDELTVDHFALLSARDFQNPMDAVKRYLKSLPGCPDKASFAVAGKVTGDSVQMTFRPWKISKDDIRAATGAEHVTLVNDIEALALALPHLTGDELIGISEGQAVEHAPRVVIAAGTGLGIAALVWAGGHWVPVCGEGGQVSFPASRPDEFDVRKAFPAGDHVTAETVFSGAGLVALYVSLAHSKGQMAKKLTAPQITALGLSDEDPVAAQAVALMGTWFARFAGDVALHFGAQGGVFLAGGLAATIVPAMSRDRFHLAFEDTGKRHHYLATIPVKVIKTGADAGLRGATVALARELDGSTGTRSLLQAS